jgi:hypothetical protein
MSRSVATAAINSAVPAYLVENAHPLAVSYQGEKVKRGGLLDCGAVDIPTGTAFDRASDADNQLFRWSTLATFMRR